MTNPSPEWLLSLCWLEELAQLIARNPGLGASQDLGNMGLVELWGLYAYLRNHNNGD